MNKISICFTGHRPNKLSSNGKYVIDDKTKDIFSKSMFTTEALISEYDEIDFYVGGAIGYDQYMQTMCNMLKGMFPKKNINIIMSIPFEEQSINWKVKDRRIYDYLKATECDRIVYVDTLPQYNVTDTQAGVYHVAKMQKRNMYMVDNSDIIVAYCDGSKGGTYNCINYAKKHKKQIVNIFDIIKKDNLEE